MNIITEQVKQLREYADHLRTWKNIPLETNKTLLNQAADTIETLSAKLAAANMERSEWYYGTKYIEAEEEVLKELIEQHDKAFDLILRMPLVGNEVWHGYVAGVMQTLGFLIDNIKDNKEKRNNLIKDMCNKIRSAPEGKSDYIESKLPSLERCNSLDVLHEAQQVIDEQEERHCSGGWIVSTVIHQNVILDERLKDKRTSILITCETLKGRRYVDEVYCNCGRVENQFNGSIVAWRFLPKPYNPKE